MPSSGGSKAELTAVLGVVAAIIAILGFLGVRNFGELMQSLASHPTPTASPASPAPQPVPTFTYSPLPAPSVSPLPAPSLAPSPQGNLNDATTDTTPFTVGALLPVSFTDSNGVQYSRAASDGHPCGEAAFVSSNVQSALNDYHCSSAMTGDYLVNSGTINANNDVLVSVQVMPLSSSAASQGAYTDIPASGPWSFGIFCPNTGAGSGDCSNAFPAAQKYEEINWKHRYLVEAMAVYVNLTTNPAAQPYLKSAALAAVNASGPENYPGNQ